MFNLKKRPSKDKTSAGPTEAADNSSAGKENDMVDSDGYINYKVQGVSV